VLSAEDTRPARILMVTQSKGFKHGSVTRKEGQLAPCERVVTELGISSGLFRVDCTQDCEADFTKENLQNYDIVFFYTTGNLPIKEDVLDYFYNTWLKQQGHGFIGAHSAADTYHNDQRYWDMIGGTFNGHPWNSGDTVTVSVHDTNHPAAKPWGEEFVIKDEIYRFRNWQPEKVRVLASLNMAKTPDKIDAGIRGNMQRLTKEAAKLTAEAAQLASENKPAEAEKKAKEAEAKLAQAAAQEKQIGQGPYHVPILWVKNYGEGKVMHMSLGHNESVWENSTYQQSLLGGIQWILNRVPGDATPNPELSEAQEKKARADVAAQAAQ
jgi:type 1 glutamine amidotransferase